MVGVVIVTHLDFGKMLLMAAEGIMGPQEGCLAVSVDITHEIDQINETIQKAVEEVDFGDGVILLTDMFGGTPSNMSLALLNTGNFEVITGVNLPMLLKILGSREIPLNELALEAKSSGRQGIVVAGEVLKRKIANG